MDGSVDMVAVLMAVVALAIGVGLGWLLGLHTTWHGLAWRRTRLRDRQN